MTAPSSTSRSGAHRPAGLVPRVVAALPLALFGCVFELAAPVVPPEPDPGCPQEAPRRCGFGCQPDAIPCLPADVAGSWAVTLVNRSDECNLEGFDDPGSTAFVPILIEQDEDRVTMVVDGLAGFFLELGFGGEPVFRGTVEGDAVVASFVGVRSFVEGGCAWTIRSTIELQATGAALVGDIVYTPRTNGHPDCAMLPVADCRTVGRVTAVPSEVPP